MWSSTFLSKCEVVRNVELARQGRTKWRAPIFPTPHFYVALGWLPSRGLFYVCEVQMLRSLFPRDLLQVSLSTIVGMCR